MSRTRHGPGKFIRMLSESEVLLAQGARVGAELEKRSITASTYYCWRQEHGDSNVDQAKRLKDLERENDRLKRLLADAY